MNETNAIKNIRRELVGDMIRTANSVQMAYRLGFPVQNEAAFNQLRAYSKIANLWEFGINLDAKWEIKHKADGSRYYLITRFTIDGENVLETEEVE